MKKGFSEQQVLELLDHLKSAGNEYPSDMIRSRRAAFVQQAAAMALVTGPSGGNGSGSAGSIPSGLESFTLGRLFEIALVLVLAAGAGIAAYIHRDAIADFVSSTLFPKVEVTAIPPQDSSSEPAFIPVTGREEDEDASDSPQAVPTTLTSSPTAADPVTVTGTPEPSLAPAAGQDSDITEDTNTESLNVEDTVQVQSTPAPNDGSGLHLGQTPKPERTLPPNENSPPIDQDNSSKKDRSP